MEYESKAQLGQLSVVLNTDVLFNFLFIIIRKTFEQTLALKALALVAFHMVLGDISMVQKTANKYWCTIVLKHVLILFFFSDEYCFMLPVI